MLPIWSILQSLLLCFCGAVSSSIIMVSDQTEFQDLLALRVYDIMIDLTSTLHSMESAYFSSPTYHAEKKLLLHFQGRRIQDKHMGSLSTSPHSLTHSSQWEDEWFPWWVRQGAPEIHRTLLTKGKIMAPKIAQARSLAILLSWLICPHAGYSLPLCLLPQTVLFLTRRSSIL